MDKDIAEDFIKKFKRFNERCTSIRRQYDDALNSVYTRMRKDYNRAKEDAIIKAKIEFLKKHCPFREGDLIACEGAVLDNFECFVKEIHITDGLGDFDHLLIWLEDGGPHDYHTVLISDIDKIRVAARLI